MTDIYTEGKIKPAVRGDKVADFPDIAGMVTLTQVVEAIREGAILLPDSNGELPDPSLAANQGRLAVSGNQFVHSIDIGAHDKIVAFKEYGPDRVVLTGEPALLQDEADFGGSFAAPPPIGNYSAGDYVWDYGSQIWLTKFANSSTTWLGSGGPHGYAPGHIYATEAVAASHVTGMGYFHLGGVVIYGQGSAQKPYVITGYTAPGDHLWHWDPIGLTIGDVQGAINNSSVTNLSDTPASLGTAGQVWKVNAAGTALEAADEATGRRQIHVLLASNYQQSNRRISANLPTGETEVLGDIHTFLVPSIIGSETSGTAVSLYVGVGAAHTIVNPAGDDVFPGDLTAGTRYWVQAIATSYVLIEEPGAAATTLFGRGEPPEATDALVGMRFLDLISQVEYGCFSDPHRTAESTGDFDDISRADIEIRLDDRIEDIPVTEDEWLYLVRTNRFYAGTDVGANQLAWVDDTADNALAGSLTTSTNTVFWLGRHLDNAEALGSLTALAANTEYFYYREQDGEIAHLDNSTFSAAGSTVAHPYWAPIKADDREAHVFNARDGLPALANDGSDDNRIGITNDGVYIVDVDPISATAPTADSWADYAATDYEGAFAADPTIDTGHWYANYTRRTFREFESTNFGLGWIPHDAPAGFIGWYTSRQDALDHAQERGVATGGNFVAFTGTSGTPKVETATDFTPAESARVQRNWVFVPVLAGTKADTDLQNIDQLTASEQAVVLPRIGARSRDTVVKKLHVRVAGPLTADSDYTTSNGASLELKARHIGQVIAAYQNEFLDGPAHGNAVFISSDIHVGWHITFVNVSLDSSTYTPHGTRAADHLELTYSEQNTSAIIQEGGTTGGSQYVSFDPGQGVRLFCTARTTSTATFVFQRFSLGGLAGGEGVLALPANGVTVEAGNLYHGDGIYSIYVYTPTSDFSLTAETRPETGADWQTMWSPVVAGVKEVGTYPVPSAVHDRDARKIFFQRDSNGLPTELRHLKSVDVSMFVLTTGSTSSSHGRRYGYERDQYGALTGFLNISKLDELPLGANSYRLEMHVDSSGAIPRANTIRTVYLRKRGASHWRVYHAQNGLLGEYTSPNYNNRRLEEGAKYDVIVISNSQGSDGQQVENVHEEDRYAAFPSGRNWARFAELDDFNSVEVIVEHLVAMSNVPDATSDTRVLLSKNGVYVLEAPATVRSDIGLGDSNDRIPAARLPGKVVHEATADYHTGGIIQLDPSPDNPVGSGDVVTFFAPSNLAQDSTNLSARIGLGTTSELKDRDGTRLQANDLTRGSLYTVLNDSTGWIIESLPTGGGAVAVRDEGIELTDNAGTIDFTGTGVQASVEDGTVTVNIGTGDAADDEVQAASAVSYVSASTRIQVTLDKHPADGDMFSFDVPAAISTTSTTNVSLRVHDGSTFGADRDLLGLDGSNLNPTDLTVSRTTLIQRVGNNYVVMSPLHPSSSGSGDLKGQRVAFITFGAVPTSGSSLETSASGSGTRLDSGDIGGVGSDVGWTRDPTAPTAFTVERIGASSDEPVINVPNTRAAADAFGYLVELEILPSLGSLSFAISDSATSIIFADLPTEEIAVGDDLRIESEVVTVDAVPADGATGAALRTYGIVRAQDGTTAAAHTNTRLVQKNSYELESDGIILQGGPSPQQGGSISRSTISLGTGGLVDATGIRELGVRLNSTRSTTGLSGLEQTRFIDLISQGDNAVLLPSTRITVYLAVTARAVAASGGQESPGTPGVAELTAGLVQATFYAYATSAKAAPTSSWRFDDEWSGDAPGTEGWYTSDADALTNAMLDPDFATSGYYLQIAREQVRRRVVNDAYSYTDSGWTVVAAWGVQYSTDASSWHDIYAAATDRYMRFRQPDGTLSQPVVIGAGELSWVKLLNNEAVYRTTGDFDVIGFAHDLSQYSMLLLDVTGFRNVTRMRDDGMGGMESYVVKARTAHQRHIMTRGDGWPVSGVSSNDVDGTTYQFAYNYDNFLEITLLTGEAVPNIAGSLTIGTDNLPSIAGGRFKFVAIDGTEANVSVIRTFHQPATYHRLEWNIWGLPREIV